MSLAFDFHQPKVVAPLGDSLELVRAALAAGVSAYCAGPANAVGVRATTAPVPDGALPPPPKHSPQPRFWQLLAAVLEGVDRAAPVVINLPTRGAVPSVQERTVLVADYLGYGSGGVHWWAGGRAGLPELLAIAQRLLQAGAAAVTLAAVEAGCEPDAVAHAAAEGRLLSSENADGRVPAEAAATVKVTAGRRLRIAGSAFTRTSVWNEKPALGALAQVLNQALDDAAAPPLAAVYSTATGERGAARELAVALTRAEPGTAAGARIELPARLLGDCGAAAPVLHLLLATAESRYQALLGADDGGGRSAVILRIGA